MTDLLAARYQMALSLIFHIVFAAIGVAMPFLMATSHWFYLRHGDSNYRTLTQAWSKGVAIFFAVGAVSGTALSFELGLLWPRFMKYAGPIIGMPFSWEGTAFFLEAIALGIFLYGWDRVSRRVHWASGFLVGIFGVASAFFVICANGWMNSPAGFDWNHGNPIHIDPWAAMFNQAAFIEGIHMVVAAFEAVAFAVAGLHAFLFLRRGHEIHKLAVKIAFVFAAVAALIQPVIGDFAAKGVAVRQPVKLAAMEGLFETTTRAPLLIGGIPDEARETTQYGFKVPGLLSFLAYGDFNAEVKGLKEVPKDERPPVLITHLAFQTMVGTGTLLAMIAVLGLFLLWKRPEKFTSRRMFRVLTLCTPLGFIALEAGWIVTEVGRQPWVIYKILRTADSLTPDPDLVYSLIMYGVLYAILSLIVVFLLYRQTIGLHREIGDKA